MKNNLLPLLFSIVLLACSNSDGPDGQTEAETETLEQPSSLVNYDSMQNWAFHPEQNINYLGLYNLDIGIVNKNLELEGTIQVENNASNNTGVDVFFVHPTLVDNSPSEATVVALESQPTTRIDLTIIAQGGLLAKYGRFFAPRYRQSSGATYISDDIGKAEQAEVIMQSYSDVKAAFLNYLDNHNNGNKIILAGHSQGSFLISMLVRDLFDEDESLRNKLVIAALGGIGTVYAEQGTYVGGQFKFIPFCTQINECGCVQNWRSFKDGQPYNEIAASLPFLNEELVKYGVYYRTVNFEEDWLLMDETYIDEKETPFRYIALGNNVNESHGFNYVAHDNLYVARTRRDSNTEIGLNVAFNPEMGDQRINDLAEAEEDTLFDFWGYHTKDYAIYLWPLLQQIDAKLANCN